MRRSDMWRYRIGVLALMAVYVALMMLEWPYARATQDNGGKIALALLPVVPVLGTIGLMGWRVLRSDELEQRVHMVALGVATGVVAAATLVGGFLAAAHAVALGGDALIWVFPLQAVAYGLARTVLLRRYGGRGC
ncbi:MAG TPA: hypothetical protein VGC30_15355 [Dokdonella sp.]